MPSVPNGSDRYQLHHSKKVGAVVRKLYQRAVKRGQGEQFLSALRRIARLLHKDPWSVGEPLYRLPKLGLHVRTVAIAPVAIDFAISEDSPHVYIKGVSLLSPRGI